MLFRSKLARCGAATMRAVDPIASLTAKAPSFLIMHGDADVTVPIVNSERLRDALNAKGAKPQMIAYPGLGHGFGGASPEQKQAILGVTLDFIQEKAKSSPP